MKKTYTTLEKDYGATLGKIGVSLGIAQKRTVSKTFPSLLEKESIKRLKPSRKWIISGISGSGKTTVSKVLEHAGFKKLPNVVTRPRRFNEKNSENVFTDTKTFLKWRKEGLLFHPHKRNGAWHAILKSDIKKLQDGKIPMYMDKSIASSIALLKSLPKSIRITFIYLIVPSFLELYKRICSRETEQAKKGKKALNDKEIFYRFEEEISDMGKVVRLPYVYLVNDSPKRIQRIISKFVKNS